MQSTSVPFRRQSMNIISQFHEGEGVRFASPIQGFLCGYLFCRHCDGEQSLTVKAAFLDDAPSRRDVRSDHNLWPMLLMSERHNR